LDKIQNGIPATDPDKKERVRKFGKNDPVVKAPKTLWEMVLEIFDDQTIQILCFAAIASLILGTATHGLSEGWLEGVSILLAVAIITVVTSGNNYMKEQQFRKLSEVAARKDVNVTRNGQVLNMSVYDLLVGDIVQIETGEIISVDGIVVKANRLTLD
jgi:magnesium-transporting ATPase (P-type)